MGSKGVNFKRIIFHHIPKTASTYVRLHTEKAIGGKSCIIRLCHLENPHYRSPQLRGTIDRMSASIYLVASHYAFRDYVPVEGELYITWLRNPVDLFYSAWNYFRRSATPSIQASLFKPLRDQVIHMCRHKGFNTYLDAALGGMSVYPQLQFDLDWKAFGFVGVAEQMQYSLSRLSSMLGVWIGHPGGKVRPTMDSPIAVLYDHRRDEIVTLLSKELGIYRQVAEEWGYEKDQKKSCHVILKWL